MKKKERRRPDVVLLKDLAPREDVKGGAGKRVFGDVDGHKDNAQRPERPKRRRK